MFDLVWLSVRADGVPDTVLLASWVFDNATPSLKHLARKYITR